MKTNVDLHSHSQCSDGALCPAALAQRASERGVTCWALTDHDTLAGVDEAQRACRALGMPFVAGVEISATYEGQTIHVLGLAVDPDSAALTAGLATNRAHRAQRAHAIAQRLEQCGIDHAFEGALRHAQAPESLGRVHFARFLLERGACKTFRQAFERYLGDGKRADVPARWAGLAQVIEWIHAAGGKAVIAHPGGYRLDARAEQTLFDRFRALGGCGLEVLSSSHDAKQTGHYAQVARRYGFEASRGSDFHTPGIGRIELGHLPPLPPGLVPVWHDWTLSTGAARTLPASV